MLKLGLGTVEMSWNQFALAADITYCVDRPGHQLFLRFWIFQLFRIGRLVTGTVIFFVTLTFAFHTVVVSERTTTAITTLPAGGAILFTSILTFHNLHVLLQNHHPMTRLLLDSSTLL